MAEEKIHGKQKLLVVIIVILSLIGTYVVLEKAWSYVYQVPLEQKEMTNAIDVPHEAEIKQLDAPGVVLETNDSVIDGAYVDRIQLYVPEKEGSDKKIVRYAKLIRYKNAVGTIVISHGFMTDGHDVGFLRMLFPQGKYNIVTFDFRAHGECAKGQQCTFGKNEAFEVCTAVHFLKHYPVLHNKPIIGYGFSMGAVSTLQAQAREGDLFKALIVDCPFDSSATIINRALESIKLSFFGYQFNIPAMSLMQKHAFHPYIQETIKTILRSTATLSSKNIDIQMYPIDTAKVAKNIKVPCFFIHCKNDELVSIDSVKRIYEKVSSPYKLLWVTNGRRHYDSFFYNPEEYIKRVRLFVDNVITGKIEHQNKQQIVEDAIEGGSNEVIMQRV